MKVHLVGGFLGSGKTTAIVGTAGLLASKGVSVGVVTNDQGRSLVDTELVRSQGIPAAEVTGGCFCCNLPDLETMIGELARRAGPRVIFAEPVGSCADLVATVLKPLAASRGPGREIGRLSVFVDVRLLRQRLSGRALPFGSDVQYIFDSQIEEAGILVLNKSDLLAAEVGREVMAKAQARYPGKTVLLQSSLDLRDLQGWVDELDRGGGAPRGRTAAIDYDRYARGEMGLAWYDARLAIDLPGETGRETSMRLIDELRRALRYRGSPVGHLKLGVRHERGTFKASITSEDGSPQDVHELTGRHLEVAINARVEDSAEGLAAAIREGVARALSADGIAWKITGEESFHPSRPKPFLRMP